MIHCTYFGRRGLLTTAEGETLEWIDTEHGRYLAPSFAALLPGEPESKAIAARSVADEDNRCPACGDTDCLCAQFQPDCPACLHPEDECECDYYPDDPDDGSRDDWDDVSRDEWGQPW